jgi:predicted DNA binding CopG/RHH family protein
MKKKKSVLEKLSSKEIEEITSTAEKKKNVPLIKSQKVNMRLDKAHLERAQTLAKLHGLPYTTFLTQLLCEDLDRLWNVYKKTKKKLA